MKLTISRESILKPLQVVSGVVEKRQTLPILSNVLVSLRDSKISMVGTDLEVELKASTPIEGITENFEITLPARKFMDICKSLPDSSELTIEFDSDRARIRSGKSRFTLSTLPATDFPASETISSIFDFSLTQQQLKELIDKTQFCMANQDVRYYLNGLLLEIDGSKLRCVATDGHRLAISQIDADFSSAEKRQIIIPRKGISELSRLLTMDDSPCSIQMSTNFIRINLGEIEFVSKLIDGRFPDYERVLPKNSNKIVTAERESIRQGLVRASILSNEKYRGVRLNLHDNQIEATVNNPDQEEAEEILDVQYHGEPLEIGFNVSYLVDALNTLRSDTVTIELSDSNSSCLIYAAEDKSTQYVVMPMRI